MNVLNGLFKQTAPRLRCRFSFYVLIFFIQSVFYGFDLK